MSNLQVMRLCCTGKLPVGLVKCYDENEECWKYYIGVGDGNDVDADVRKIIAMGQRYYSLSAIAEFEEAER